MTKLEELMAAEDASYAAEAVFAAAWDSAAAAAWVDDAYAADAARAYAGGDCNKPLRKLTIWT